MKSILILAIIILTIGACIGIPFIINTQEYSKLGTGLDILSALSTFLTLIVALLLYNRYGIEQTVLDKQTESVLSLLTTIKNTGFMIRGDKMFINFMIDRQRLSHFINDNRYKNILLAFSDKYMENMKDITAAMDNVFLPKQILKCCKPLRIMLLTGVTDIEKTNNKYFIVAPYTTKDEDKDKFIGVLNDEETSLVEYSRLWDNLLTSIEQWLQDNSSIKIDLNL